MEGVTFVIEAVIFDMDGVLVDTEEFICEAAMKYFAERGVQVKAEDFLDFVGMGENRYIGGVAERHGVPYVPEMKRRVYEIYLDILPSMIRPVPGVEELLRRLRARRVPMAVATSADRIKMEANLRAIQVPLDWFGARVVGEDVARKKPAPDIYLEAARRLGVAPETCCVVEDAVNGIVAAKAAGMRCIAVESSFPAATLLAAAPDGIRPSMADITLADLGLA